MTFGELSPRPEPSMAVAANLPFVMVAMTDFDRWQSRDGKLPLYPIQYCTTYPCHMITNYALRSSSKYSLLFVYGCRRSNYLHECEKLVISLPPSRPSAKNDASSCMNKTSRPAASLLKARSILRTWEKLLDGLAISYRALG
jgi:hypothetical protein